MLVGTVFISNLYDYVYFAGVGLGLNSFLVFDRGYQRSLWYATSPFIQGGQAII